MLIHELTRKKPVNEGIGGALAAVAGGIAKQVGTQAINKSLGTDVTSQDGPNQSREQGFQDLANSSAAKTLAATMQTAWQQTVQNFMANSKDSSGNPPTSLSQVTQPSIATLKTNLQDLVNKMLGRSGVDYRNLPNSIGDPTQKLYAEKVVADIDKSVDAIYDATLQNTDSKTVADLFTALVGMGVLPAQNMAAYDRKSAAQRNKTRLYTDPDGRRVIDLGQGPEWFDEKNPEHIKVRDQYLKGTATT